MNLADESDNLPNDMKVAAVIILACILLSVLVLFLAAIALSAARRARMRGDAKGEMDFSDSETVRFTREIMEARQAKEESEESEDE